MSDNKYYYALGRRKTSVATVRLYNVAGKSKLNESEFEKIYSSAHEQRNVMLPFEVAGLKAKDFFFTAVAKGGGKISQLNAVQLGIARAIVKFNPELKGLLKKEGLLTRDPRMVERKKTGLKKARKAEQYSKR
jgi:small subunit ribosomal protein S9